MRVMSGQRVDPPRLLKSRSVGYAEREPGAAVSALRRQIPADSKRLMAALLVLVAVRGLSGSVRSVTGWETGEMGQQLQFRVAVLRVVRALARALQPSDLLI